MTRKIIDHALELQETVAISPQFSMCHTYATTLSVSWHAKNVIEQLEIGKSAGTATDKEKIIHNFKFYTLFNCPSYNHIHSMHMYSASEEPFRL